MDRLGRLWEGEENDNYEWKFEFRRRYATSNIFNGYWRHHEHGELKGPVEISLHNLQITIQRGSAAGVPCTYTGKYVPADHTNGLPARVQGTYTCANGYTGPWRAKIY